MPRQKGFSYVSVYDSVVADEIDAKEEERNRQAEEWKRYVQEEAIKKQKEEEAEATEEENRRQQKVAQEEAWKEEERLREEQNEAKKAWLREHINDWWTEVSQLHTKQRIKSRANTRCKVPHCGNDFRAQGIYTMCRTCNDISRAIYNERYMKCIDCKEPSKFITKRKQRCNDCFSIHLQEKQIDVIVEKLRYH